MTQVLHLDLGRTYRGGQRQLFLLAREQAAAGLHPTVFTACDVLREDLAREGVIAHEVGISGGLMAPGLWRSSRQATVLHAHDSRAHGVLRALAPPRTKLFVHRRIDDPPRDRSATRWKYSRGQFLCVSSAIEKGLSDFGVPADRRRVIYSAVPRAKLRQSTPAADGTLRLLSLGALVVHKGHSGLITALNGLDLSVHLDIAGVGPEREALASAAGNHVRLLGDPGGRLPDFAAYDLLVHPSITEGLGTAVLDAQAAGLPVLATDVGGLSEAVAPSCWLVPASSPRLLAGALRSIAALDRSELVARGCKARDWVHPRFSLERMVQQVTDAYREVR